MITCWLSHCIFKIMIVIHILKILHFKLESLGTYALWLILDSCGVFLKFLEFKKKSFPVTCMSYILFSVQPNSAI